ncbi:hypothetical protein Tco_0346438, partial [Tanacetum coccineum]
PRILGVGYKLNGMEAKVDDYDDLGDSTTRWKGVGGVRLQRSDKEVMRSLGGQGR